jgi:hypothetical protein
VEKRRRPSPSYLENLGEPSTEIRFEVLKVLEANRESD